MPREARRAVVERFDYSSVGPHWAVLRLLARLGGPELPGTPSMAELVVTPFEAATPRTYAARACALERRLVADRSGRSELLWRASFALPLEVIEAAEALFELTSAGGRPLALPLPVLRAVNARTLTISPYHETPNWFSARQARHRALALATAMAVSGAVPASAAGAVIAGTSTTTTVAATPATVTASTAAPATTPGAAIAPATATATSTTSTSATTAPATSTTAATTTTPAGASLPAAATSTTSTTATPAPAPATATAPTASAAELPSASAHAAGATRRPHDRHARTHANRLRVTHLFSTGATPAPGRPATPDARPQGATLRSSGGVAATPGTTSPGATATTPGTPSPGASATPTSGPGAPAATPGPSGTSSGAATPGPATPGPAAAEPSSTAATPAGAHSRTAASRAPHAVSHASGGAALPPAPTPPAAAPTPTVTELSPTPAGFLAPTAWTGTVAADPALTGAVTDLSGLLADADRPPSFLIPIYMEAGRRYHVPWEVLAAINAIESDYGRDLNTSSAGAIGWMQFEPSTWRRYGVAADGHSVPNPYDPRDAIFSAARYLAAAGAADDMVRAVFAYNHASWYVDEVLARATAIAHHVQYERRTVRRGTFSVYFATGVRRRPTIRYRGGFLSHYDRIIASANMVSAADFPYLWGGGHEQPARFGPFDCSGSVSYVMQQAGYKVPTTVSGDISSWKFPAGPGRVTIFYNPTHTFMRIGNRFFGTSGFARPGGGAGWFDVNRLPAGYLANFSEVHVPHLGINSFAPVRHRAPSQPAS